MSERYDLCSPRERKEKTYWHKVGAAFKDDKGGFSLSFDSLPLPDKEGNVRLKMFLAKDRHVNPADALENTSNVGGAMPPNTSGGYIDDSLPF